MATQTTPRKRIGRALLLLALCAALTLGGVALYRFVQTPGGFAKSAALRENWKLSAGTTYKSAALASGEALVVVAESANRFVVLVDRQGRQVWREPLTPDAAGTNVSSRGMIVYSPNYVRYYEARGHIWQWKPESPVATAFPTTDGGAIVSCKIVGVESDPRGAPFSERIIYIDPKGKKIWEKPPIDRVLVWAESSADGEILSTCTLGIGGSMEAAYHTFRRNGTALNETRGEGNLFTRSKMSPTADISVLGLVGRITGVSTHGRWFYQVDGDVRSLGMGPRKEAIALVKPKSKNAVMDMFQGPALLCVSAQGTKIWEKRVDSGSYASWTDIGIGQTIVASPDGLTGYDSTGTKAWQVKTQTQVRSVSFFPDGSFLSTSGSGSVIHYTR